MKKIYSSPRTAAIDIRLESHILSASLTKTNEPGVGASSALTNKRGSIWSDMDDELTEE